MRAQGHWPRQPRRMEQLQLAPCEDDSLRRTRNVDSRARQNRVRREESHRLRDPKRSPQSPFKAEPGERQQVLDHRCREGAEMSLWIRSPEHLSVDLDPAVRIWHRDDHPTPRLQHAAELSKQVDRLRDVLEQLQTDDAVVLLIAAGVPKRLQGGRRAQAQSLSGRSPR